MVQTPRMLFRDGHEPGGGDCLLFHADTNQGEDMDEDDKNVIKKLIDAFITKKQVQKLAH